MPAMKKTFLFLAALAAFTLASAEQVTLKVDQVIQVANALASLDSGQTKVVKFTDQTGATSDKAVQLPYELSGATRWAIARDLGALKKEVEAFDKARTDVIKQLTNGGSEIKKEETVKMAKYLDQVNDILQKPVKVELQKIKGEDLKLDINPIPSTTLAALEPVLTN